jgi:hypothetical protein
MLREAELFVMAEQMLVEVLGRIRAEDRDIVIPAFYDSPSEQVTRPVHEVVEDYVRDDAAVPDLLAGRTMHQVGQDRFAGDLLGDDWDAGIARVADAAMTAASKVDDGDALVHTGYGDVSTSSYLLRLTIDRSFVAHYIATYLGSTACPLPEELARPLWELTAPAAATWRELGIFREPMRLPDHVSWRDRFLLTAGHLPHPLGH